MGVKMDSRHFTDSKRIKQSLHVYLIEFYIETLKIKKVNILKIEIETLSLIISFTYTPIDPKNKIRPTLSTFTSDWSYNFYRKVKNIGSKHLIILDAVASPILAPVSNWLTHKFTKIQVSSLLQVCFIPIG